MTQNKITGQTNTSFSSDLPEQAKPKKAYNKSSFKRYLVLFYTINNSSNIV